MTLQQLRYLIAISECGSISSAAHDLFVSQSCLSIAIKDLEREMGITIFSRSNRGIALTAEGEEFLTFARQVVDQADLMEQRYSRAGQAAAQRLAVSSQHYTFCVEAFIQFIDEYGKQGETSDAYDFILRETRTSEIIEDVRDFRSDVGILYLSKANRRVLEKAFEDASLTFTSLFRARPHVFLGEDHPLASKSVLTPDDLAEYPRYSFEQGTSSFYYSEEPLSELPHKKRISVSDRGTLSNLLAHHNGYTLSTGVLSSEMHTGIAAVPLKTDELMDVGYIVHAERPLSALAQRYIETLQVFIESYVQSSSAL